MMAQVDRSLQIESTLAAGMSSRLLSSAAAAALRTLCGLRLRVTGDGRLVPPGSRVLRSSAAPEQEQVHLGGLEGLGMDDLVISVRREQQPTAAFEAQELERAR